MGFVPRVVLPLSEKNMELLEDRFVLSLSSNVNIRLWGVSHEFEDILKKMNLSHVKEVKFVGNNYSVCGGGLTSIYKKTLGNIFLCKKFIRKLDISIDSSEECYRQLKRLNEMPFLEELSLRSSGGFSNGKSWVLNWILEETLRELKIHTFELKGFALSWDLYEDFELRIYSKNIQITEIVAENLKEIQIFSDDYCTYCLIRAQS